MKKVVGLLIAFIYLSVTVCGQTLNVSKLDSFFNILSNHGLAMGSLTISKNGKILYQKAIGYSFIDSAKKMPATLNTKYRIGSATKMFTAVMVFQLIEEGKLRLDQKLDHYFPGLPNASGISISNLLNHRSGLHNYTDNTNFQDWMDKPKTHDEMLRLIAEKGVDFEPDAKAEYSNTNYLLLGYIIEKVCKMPYDSALNKRILSRIGLKQTYYGGPISIVKNESASYKYRDSSWKKEKETNLSLHGGAGSLVSNPTDMVKFIEALFNNKLISKTSLQMMQSMTDGYGKGMFPFDHASKKGYGHNGRVEEFYSALRYFPGDKLAFAYCTNGILYPRTDILEGIMKICFNEPYTLPFSNPAGIQTIDPGKYLGSYKSEQVPMIVTCTRDKSQLLLETGGKIFVTEQIASNYFMHAATGYFFEFYPEKNELLIKETDNVYYFKKTGR